MLQSKDKVPSKNVTQKNLDMVFLDNNEVYVCVMDISVKIFCIPSLRI